MVVRADNRAYGEKACQFLGTKLGGKGKVVMLEGDLASINGRDRTEAFNDCMKQNFPGIKVFGEATEWDGDVAASEAADRLTREPGHQGRLHGVAASPSPAPSRCSSSGTCWCRRPTRSTSSSSPTTASRRSSRTSRAGQIDATVSQPADLYAKYGALLRQGRDRRARRSSPARPTTTAPSSRSATGCWRTSSRAAGDRRRRHHGGVATREGRRHSPCGATTHRADRPPSEVGR